MYSSVGLPLSRAINNASNFQQHQVNLISINIRNSKMKAGRHGSSEEFVPRRFGLPDSQDTLRYWKDANLVRHHADQGGRRKQVTKSEPNGKSVEQTETFSILETPDQVPGELQHRPDKERIRKRTISPSGSESGSRLRTSEQRKRPRVRARNPGYPQPVSSSSDSEWDDAYDEKPSRRDIPTPQRGKKAMERWNDNYVRSPSSGTSISSRCSSPSVASARSRASSYSRSGSKSSRYSKSRSRSRSRSRSSSSSSASSASTAGKRSRRRKRSPSIPRRRGSPSFLDRRRITSARKRPVPYNRPSRSSSVSSHSSSSSSGSSRRSASRSRSRSSCYSSCSSGSRSRSYRSSRSPSVVSCCSSNSRYRSRSRSSSRSSFQV